MCLPKTRANLLIAQCKSIFMKRLCQNATSGVCSRPLFKRFHFRQLHLHEHQTKALLKRHGVNVEKYVVVNSTEQAEDELKNLPDANGYVVKAQILAGGRMKGHFANGLRGGVQLAAKAEEAIDYVDKMIGHNLITKQTGEEGINVKKVMIAEKINFLREAYVAILMDRESSSPVFMVSSVGGVNVEEMMKANPDQMHKIRVNVEKGLSPDEAMNIAERIDFRKAALEEVAKQLHLLYEAFVKMDATQVEINPFIDAEDNKVYCVDAKVHFDDSAAFRQREIFKLKNDDDSHPIEKEASKFGLNYVSLSGNIGCLVNGAGLAMATMDVIKHYGGEPANFMDIRGSVTEETVAVAVKLLLIDPKVKCAFINIFGGIVNCETIARGLVTAMLEAHIQLPLIIRLLGTNSKLAYSVLDQAGVHYYRADDLADGAEKAVQCASGA